jgi:hypothetical protein
VETVVEALRGRAFDAVLCHAVIPYLEDPGPVVSALVALARPQRGGVGGGHERVVGSMNTVKPTRRVVLEMVEEFVTAVERLDDLVKRD